MKNLILVLSVMIPMQLHAQPQRGRDISITLTPYQNCFIYLACYYGNGKIMADTAWLNEKSEGHFNSRRNLTPGMYFVVSPDNRILFEFLLDSGQRFSIMADTAGKNNVMFTGSPDNELFKEYLTICSAIALRADSLGKQLQTAKYRADSMAIEKEKDALDNVLNLYRETIIQKAPASMMALYINAAKKPQLPGGMMVKTKQDTIAAAYYIKKHFWDNVPFNDDRLLYTAFFEPKIDEYFRDYVPPIADSVIKEMDYILAYARTGKEMYPYLLTKFTNRYLNPDHVGQNKVFLDLFQNYYLKGDTDLLSPQSKKAIFDRAYMLMANRAGDPAPPLDLTDTAGKVISLYSVKARYTFLVFWDPECSHCRKELPVIDSFYKAKWKKLGLRLYSININSHKLKEMKQFIIEKKLSPDWLHTYQTDSAAKQILSKGLPNYHQLYDIYDTPTCYLLDAGKHIIAKHLTLAQFDALLDVKKKK